MWTHVCMCVYVTMLLVMTQIRWWWWWWSNLVSDLTGLPPHIIAKWRWRHTNIFMTRSRLYSSLRHTHTHTHDTYYILLSTCVCMNSVYLSAISQPLHIFICLSIHAPIHPSSLLFIHQSDRPSIHPSMHVPIHPSINLRIHSSMHPTIPPILPHSSFHQTSQKWRGAQNTETWRDRVA